jgi:hypothetical protein
MLCKRAITAKVNKTLIAGPYQLAITRVPVKRPSV